MKKILFKAWLITGALFLLFTSCNKKENPVPVASTQADFAYTLSNNGYAPCTVTLTNKSVAAAAYLWDFGNGKTSTEANPVITYDSAGIFNITLTCTPETDVYYNKLTKSLGVNIKSPEAPAVIVMYFADRAAGKLKFVVLDGNPPVVQEFPDGGFSQMYGIAVDTVNRKVYFTDYSGGAIYMTNPDGSGLTKIITTDLALDGPYGIVVVGSKIYWAMQNAIWAANLDGSNPAIDIDFGGNIPKQPLDLKFDPAGQKLYFVNDRYTVTNGGGLWSVNLDGSGLTNIIPDLDAGALDLDIQDGKMYMAAYAVAGTGVTADGIYMSNINGSGIQQIGNSGAKATWGIAHNHVSGKLYWGSRASASAADGIIIQGNLDGSNQSDFLTQINPYALTVVKIKL